MEKSNILITGGSGLVGNRLTEILLEKGYNVVHLSRKEDFSAKIKKYRWNPSQKYIDTNALKNIDHIVHLAGAGVADERWTDERKKEILSSRVDSSALLFETLKNNKNSVKAVVSASAIGYYGFNNGNSVSTEHSKPGNDFLAEVTHLWENEVDRINELVIRVVKMRIGVVLTTKGGALPQMAMPIKFFVGSPLGSGEQIVSWIDLDDLCNMFVHALENIKMKGAYNAVAPNPVTNAELTKAMAKVLNRPVWPISVPKFFLKIVVGEMEQIITGSSFVANKRIAEETDFKYQYQNVEDCLAFHLGADSKK
jgi:uncharacterized protein